MSQQKIAAQNNIEGRGLTIDADVLRDDGLVGERRATDLQTINDIGACESCGGVCGDGGERPPTVHQATALATIDAREEKQPVLVRAPKLDLFVTEFVERASKIRSFACGKRVLDAKRGEQDAGESLEAREGFHSKEKGADS